MNMLFGEIVMLRLVVARLLAREAVASGDPAGWLAAEATAARVTLDDSTIRADNPADEAAIRSVAISRLTELFDGIHVT